MQRRNKCPVKILTLCLLLAMFGCTTVQTERYQSSCNSRAYLQLVLSDYLSKRYRTQSPVRLGIAPLSAPENLSYRNAEFPGLGTMLSEELHRLLLQSGELPIVELFRRQDWPRKREEFSTGNHQAIAFAREAGYNLLLVGAVEPQHSLNELSVILRLIEVDSGTTIYHGRTTVQRQSELNMIYDLNLHLRPGNRQPSDFSYHTLIRELAACAVSGILSEYPIP